MEVVMCDRCKTVADRRAAARMTYRPYNASYYTTNMEVVELDLCKVCAEELFPQFAVKKELVVENGEDDG